MANPVTAFATALAAVAVVAVVAGAAYADNPTPYPGTMVVKTPFTYKQLIKRLDGAVKKNRMGLVTRASATLGARSLGVTIPGNMVIGVYAPKFAVRMLKASVAAGIEAPLRFYITANADGTATLTYRKPSSTFAPYDSAALNAMAAELDAIFARIAGEATGRR